MNLGGMNKQHAHRQAPTSDFLQSAEEFPPLGGVPPNRMPMGGQTNTPAQPSQPPVPKPAPEAATSATQRMPPATSSGTAPTGSQGSATPPPQGAAQGDRFGLTGLLSVIRMTDQDLNALALGFDLTTLGLNLNSPDYLYTTFASPWSEGTTVQPEFRIPQCYFMTPPHLRFQMFQRFHLETLFYIFYSMPADVLQLAAAQELYNRDWRFHKEKKLWFTRAPGVEPSIKTTSYEKGSYLVFDPEKWTKEQKDDFILVYDQLEEKTSVQTGEQAGNKEKEPLAP
uniref:NOT2/NOT3/NOT5 C-terminal domain-containing protein n=1 Tax=Eutreptiella gymnastica TaxID=73025 RepID=A0A7S1N8S3_9EUGL|mmetsp:Transcript_138384/g.240628  ORF Transcript_138384/g.240628 Transcript_138384/m.240628 type:complete len:283 (+) Transcript_138384:54-902(+)